MKDKCKIWKCSSCNKIHFEFGNITFDFKNEIKLNSFYEYLISIKKSKYFNPNRMVIPFRSSGISMVVNENKIDNIVESIKTYQARNIESGLSSENWIKYMSIADQTTLN